MLQYGKIVTKLGYDARFQDFKVQNIVGSTDVKFPIRLEGLAYSHAVFASVRASSPSPDSFDPPDFSQDSCIFVHAYPSQQVVHHSLISSCAHHFLDHFSCDFITVDTCSASVSPAV